MICLLLSCKHLPPQNCIIIWNSVLTLGSFWIQNFLVDFCFFLHLWHIYNSVSSSSSRSVKLRRQSKTKLIRAAYQQGAFYRGRRRRKHCELEAGQLWLESQRYSLCDLGKVSLSQLQNGAPQTKTNQTHSEALSWGKYCVSGAWHHVWHLVMIR